MTDDELRAALTKRLADWSDLSPYGRLPPAQRQAVADALLPLVRHAQATALRDAANDEALWPHPDARIVLRDRADTLDPQP
jgi:hypothetical protein